jgi:hypothetical protein
MPKALPKAGLFGEILAPVMFYRAFSGKWGRMRQNPPPDGQSVLL